MRTNQPDLPPFVRLAPNRSAPFVLTCEHARPTLPSGISPTAHERAILRSHWGWDLGAWALTRATAQRLSTGATGGRWSRLWVDLNRPAGDPTLVRRTVEGHALSWNLALDDKELDRRFACQHRAYHAEVEREVARRMNRAIRPVLLAVHSFTPLLRGKRRNYDAGVLYDACRSEARTLTLALRRAGLNVRYNAPYSGKLGLMYSIDRHGRHHRLPCLELEINQQLLADRSVHPALAEAVATGLIDIQHRMRVG